MSPKELSPKELSPKELSPKESAAISRRDLSWMMGLLAVFLLWNFFAGEIILMGDGLGVDGVEYARITREAPEVLDHGLGPLYAGRVVPPLLVRLFIEGTGLSLDTVGVITGFKIYNSLLILASVLLWYGIAGRVHLSSEGRWLGYLVLFVNCGQLESIPYYPVFTDPSALFLSLALLHAHLSGRPWVIYLLSLVGAFTWPTLMYLGLVLFLFPHRRENVEPARPFLPRLVGAIAALGVVAGLGYGATTGYRHGLSGEWAEPGLWGYGLLAMGCLIVTIYAFGAGCVLSNQRRYFEQPWSFLSGGFFLRLAMAAVLYVTVDAVSGLLLVESVPLKGHFLVGSVMRASQRPFVFYVMHVSYFGPVVIIAAYHWHRIIGLLHSHGMGITLYGALSAILLIQPLSRQSLTVLPILALFTALAFEAHGRMSRRELWCLAALSLVMSRFWMPVNLLQQRFPINDDPIFWFRINYGKYFSDLVFWPQLVLIALLTLAMVIYLRRRDVRSTPLLANDVPGAAKMTVEGEFDSSSSVRSP